MNGFPSPRWFRGSLLGALLSLTLATVAAPALRGSSIYLIGNSVTDTVNYNGFAALAAARGYSQPWGRQMIPGAPLEWLWDHPNDGFTNAPYNYPTNALPNFAWDALSLQPFDRSLNSDVSYITNFLGLLYGSGTPTASQSSNRLNTRILILGRWPRQDDPARPGGPRTYDQLWLRSYTNPSSGDNNETADFARQLTTAVRGLSVSGTPLAERTFLVPVGQVMYELNQLMGAGQVPGFTNIFQFYSDGIHQTNFGAYLTACTYFAVLYRESPVGLPVPAQYGTIDPALALIIQQTVWNVVQVETLSGVPSAGNLLLTTPAVPPAYKDAPYSATLLAVGGIAPRSFTRSAGTLPPGITLAPDGLISGTATAAGDFDFTVTVTDATSPTPLSASRDYRLRVDLDTTPAITTAPNLPSGTHGARYFTTLQATGGNGGLTWTRTSGNLPPGVVLGGGGVLVGNALSQGTFTFTLRVDDADVPADSDTETFTIVIGPPSPETLFIQKTSSPVHIDGDLAETHWSLGHAAARGLLGNPDNSVAFGALWDSQNLYLAARIMDSELSAGTGAGAERDALEVFLDALNDKEAEFNSQHRQFRFPLDASLFERGGRTAGVRYALLMIPGGYQVELQVPWTNLGITPIADTTVIGLDIANDDSDTPAGGRTAYEAFAFSDPADPRPSQFGTAVLSSQTVSGTGGEPLAPSGPAPIAYEPFDYAAGPMHNVGGAPSTGFTGAWQAENSANTGYAATGTESLLFGALGTAGRHLTGGQAYQTFGRSLETGGATPAFGPWKRPDGLVGKDGTTLWISWLVRPLRVDAPARFALDEGGAVFHDNNGRLRVQQVGNSGSTPGTWRLQLMNGAVSVDTGIQSTANTTYFMVARLDFAATDTVRLWVNPSLDAEPSNATANATATTSDASFRFGEVVLYPGNNTAFALYDEFRFGASWASVTPQPAPPVAPVTFSPLPGTHASPTAVTLTSATPGATIRFTLDGSTPDAGSPAYTGPLALAGTTTVRAFAEAPASFPSPVSGATYVVPAGFLAWLADAGLPADTDPLGDPAGSGATYLQRFAFNLAPAGHAFPLPPGGTAGLPSVGTTGTNTLVIETVGRTGAGLRYLLRLTGDLGGWTEIDLSALPLGLTTGGDWAVTKEPAGEDGWFRALATALATGTPPRRFGNLSVEMVD